MKEPKYFVQRMDGVLLLSFIAAEAETVNTLKDFGKGMEKPFSPGVNAHGRINYFGYLWPDIHKQAKAIIRRIKKEPNFLKNLEKLWKKRVKRLKNFERKISKISLRKLSDQELAKTFRKLINLYQEEYSPALLCDPFGLHTEKIITEKLKKYLEKIDQPRKFAQYLEILTFPKKRSWANEEELNLLEIAKKIKKNKKLAEILKKDYKKAKKLIKKSLIWSSIQEHQEKFFWIKNSYAQGIKLSVDYFLKKIQRYFKENIDLEKKIKELKNVVKNYQRKKKNLIKKLKLDNETKRLLKWIEFFGYLHDQRKAVMNEANYYITIVLKEIGKRLGLSLQEMYYTDHHKIEEMLLKKKFDKKLIHQRMKCCAYLIWPNRYKILVGKEAEKWHQEFLGEKKKLIGEIKGVSASSGVVIGKAKIVKDIKDGYKIKKGDILVTGMTRPHWMPFIKKAAGIVTDEGGITCHAAIVARELGIPCIIATKVATKVLHDNDLIEINTNHNRVKILKRE